MEIKQSKDGKNILLLHVFQGEETPYYYTGDSRMEAFIRIGNESVVADTTELKRLVLRGKNTSFDAQQSAYFFEDYAFSKLKERYKVWSGQSLTDKKMESFFIKTVRACLVMPAHYLPTNPPFIAQDCVVPGGTVWIKVAARLML